MEETKHYSYKVIVIGDPRVGKTSLLNKFTTNQFKTEYLPTVGANFMTEVVKIDNKHIKMQIWDIAGQDKFSELSTSYFSGASGIVIVFDVTRRRTFRNVINWYGKCLENGIAHLPIVLTGNKIDLTNRRRIENEDAMTISDMMKAPYFETSAKVGTSVKAMFMMLANQIYNYNYPEDPIPNLRKAL